MIDDAIVAMTVGMFVSPIVDSVVGRIVGKIVAMIVGMFVGRFVAPVMPANCKLPTGNWTLAPPARPAALTSRPDSP